MAEMNIPMNRSTGRRLGDLAISAPRIVMSWEDWLTFAISLVAFVSVAVSIQQANWVRDFPPIVPTVILGLLIGMVAARMRLPAAVLHPLGIVAGCVVVVLVVQTYADGSNITERIEDFRLRMKEWFDVVVSGDISNDNLPFITLVHGIGFLAAYLASWSLFRWRNAWLAIVPGAVVLLVNIALQKSRPSEAFIFFLFGAILLVSRVHIQRSQERWKKEAVEYPDFISLSAAQLTVLVTGLVILGAWLVPLGAQEDAAKAVVDKIVAPFEGNSGLFSRLFHNIASSQGGSLHSFGDTLPIQGNVKLGSRTILEVNAGEPGLIRGASYDYYTGNGWKVTGRKEDQVEGKELAADQSATQFEKRNVTILKVTVVDSLDTIMTAGLPLGTNISSDVDRNKSFTGDIEQLRSHRGLQADDTYNSFGTQSNATDADLKQAGTEYPSWVTDRYLQLPGELPQRVKDEARQVAGNAATPYDKAKAVEDYLRKFPFDLAVESAPPRRDTVDFFLFDLKRGYFDYQATAMAVMLRTLGIPARIAVGYVLDPNAAVETKYTVHKSDAYSWVEVFFPKYGWVNFNPTADRPEGGAGGLGSASASTPAVGTPETDLNDLFLGDLGVPLPEDISTALNEEAVQHSDGPPWLLIWILAGVLAVAALTALAARIAWNWGLGDLDGRARLWAKTQRLAGWAGLGAREAETPREWSRRLGGAIERRDEAHQLAEAYEESRYGRPDLQRIDDEAASSAYVRLRNGLASKLARRKPKPPKK